MTNYKSIGHAVSRLHRLTEMYLSETFQDMNLHGSGQVRIVMFLARHKEGVSQHTLAKQLSVDKTTISRMIRPLVSHGIVKREKNKEDSRAYVICLSEDTAGKINEIRKRMARWTEILGRGLSERELELFFNLIEVITENASEFLENDNKEIK